MFANASIVSKGTNPTEYHRRLAVRGAADFAVSSSSLREFARCPSRWIAGYESPESEAKEFGSLLDCLLLTPTQFKERYAVQPAQYKAKDGEMKDWRNDLRIQAVADWHEQNKGKDVIKLSSVDEAKAAMDRMRKDEVITAWLEASESQVWIKATWKDEHTGLSIPCQCLIDTLPRSDTEFGGCAGDLKTSRCGLPQVFQRQCYQLGWHVQAAFDLDMLVAATGEDRNTWCFIGVENFTPWEPFKRMLSQDFLAIGQQTYKSALARYCQCLKAGKWPGYDDHKDAIQGWSLTDCEPWMEFQSLETAMEESHAEISQSDDLIP